jgi:type IV secretory pathway TraG/TraD family ATPase VirD4
LAPRNKTPLYGSWEDVALALMAPRSGKTSALAIPTILDAPGAVVATANKADVWQATASVRGGLTGERVWSFDPQRIVDVDQSWWWNPLRGVAEASDPIEEAERLAGHFVLTVEDSRSRDIWGPAASGLLSALILAAAVDDRSMLDVYRWLAVDGTPTPVDLLTEHGWTAAAASLSGLYSDPPETRGSVYFTARTATRCLGNPLITAWITPPKDGAELEEFLPRSFPATRQTLYLMSKDGGGAAGPLVAAMTDAVMRAGVVAAERRGGRLDAPMVVVLDEAANICRIADLPRLYSHLGSRGVVVLTILQSYSQGVTVWGENGMKELWSAATIKLIGAGIDDSKFADEISTLVGDHDVRHVSRNTGGERATRTTTTRTQRILPPSAVRAMPKGSALLMATGVKIAPITLQTWFTGPRKADVGAAIAAAAGVSSSEEEAA